MSDTDVLGRDTSGNPVRHDAATLRRLLHHPRFPRSNAYDPAWVMENEMGPNVLWLTEALVEHMRLEPGMRVLDMGCGRGLSSVFLVKEHGVRVWANDLWIPPTDVWRTAREAGVGDAICPIRAEARALPYADGFFDAIVCVDSYAYYGTDDLYLSYLVRFLAPGGQLGVVVAGLTEEIGLEPPEHLTRPQANGRVFWDRVECGCFHSTAWWREHFRRSQVVDVEVAVDLEDGCRLWAQHERARAGGGFSAFPSDLETLERDDGRSLAFPLLVARRKADVALGPHSTQIRL
jgi:SAM-dependent methyltransferase